MLFAPFCVTFCPFDRIPPRGGEVLAGDPGKPVQTEVLVASTSLAVFLACRKRSGVLFLPADDRKPFLQLSCFLLLP